MPGLPVPFSARADQVLATKEKPHVSFVLAPVLPDAGGGGTPGCPGPSFQHQPHLSSAEGPRLHWAPGHLILTTGCRSSHGAVPMVQMNKLRQR